MSTEPTVGVLRVGCNHKGRDFVCGDIHGCFGELARALRKQRFRPARDRLFSVGDLVDRGPQSAEVFDWLDKPWFFAVRGNHEEMTVHAARSYARLAAAGIDAAREVREIIAALAGKTGEPDSDEGREQRREAGARLGEIIPLITHHLNGGAWLPAFLGSRSGGYDAIERLSRLPVSIELETRHGRVGITHADVWGGDWTAHCKRIEAGSGRTIGFAQWSRRRARHVVHKGKRVRASERGAHACTVAGVDQVFVGHTIVPGGPATCGNMGFIDTGAAVRGGCLTVVAVEDWFAVSKGLKAA